MPKTKTEKQFSFESSGAYLIRIQGYLGTDWDEKLSGMRVTTSGGDKKSTISTLVGGIRDQAELAGILNTLYELHLTILSVEFLGVEEQD
jgi:hypothetical protein